jgi:hypothetical protein
MVKRWQVNTNTVIKRALSPQAQLLVQKIIHEYQVSGRIYGMST